MDATRSMLLCWMCNMNLHNRLQNPSSLLGMVQTRTIVSGVTSPSMTATATAKMVMMTHIPILSFCKLQAKPLLLQWHAFAEGLAIRVINNTSWFGSASLTCTDFSYPRLWDNVLLTILVCMQDLQPPRFYIVSMSSCLAIWQCYYLWFDECQIVPYFLCLPYLQLGMGIIMELFFPNPNLSWLKNQTMITCMSFFYLHIIWPPSKASRPKGFMAISIVICLLVLCVWQGIEEGDTATLLCSWKPNTLLSSSFQDHDCHSSNVMYVTMRTIAPLGNSSIWQHNDKAMPVMRSQHLIMRTLMIYR